MYSGKPSFIYGFHGLDKKIVKKILNNKEQFNKSENSYNWLGDGVYFWENNYERAYQYAVEDSHRKKSKIKKSFVLGAVIDLGNCLDLLDQKYLDFVKESYEILNFYFKSESLKLPENTGFGDKDFDFRKRELDCAVIRTAHILAEQNNEKFDTVRAVFPEGDQLYPNSGFKEKNHIQIAVLNPNCIKGIFLPRKKINHSVCNSL